MEFQLTDTYKFKAACKPEPSNSQTEQECRNAQRKAQTSQEGANVYMQVTGQQKS